MGVNHKCWHLMDIKNNLNLISCENQFLFLNRKKFLHCYVKVRKQRVSIIIIGI